MPRKIPTDREKGLIKGYQEYDPSKQEITKTTLRYKGEFLKRE